jgi:G3E family GTPase
MLPGAHQPKLEHVATNLVVGKSGAAKSRLLKRLEALKPQGESWAFLVTDTDQHTVSTPLRLKQGTSAAVHVAAIAGGCICCTGSVELRSTLVKLLRESRPARLIVEAPAMASTRELLRLLSDAWLAPVLDLSAVVLALDEAETFPADEADQERLAYAAVVVTNAQQIRFATTETTRITSLEDFSADLLDRQGPKRPTPRFQSEAR